MVPVAQEIHYLSLLSRVKCADFRHELLDKRFSVANVATPQTIFSFTVPANTTWFVTQIDVETYNPTPTGASDFRSDQIDYNGLTNAWITVNGNPIMAANAIDSSALFNRPVLFTFKGGDKVKVWIQRDAASLPAAAYEVQTVVNGYFALPSALVCVSTNTTQVQAAV